MQLGMVGLGRMGANMTERLRAAGHDLKTFDPNVDSRTAGSLEELVQQLDAPRSVWLMVPAGIVDSVVGELAPHLAEGDTIIDGGNSYYVDDLRRSGELSGKGIHYIDVGVSGGVWGRERGYCLMVGGDDEAVGRLTPVLEALAPGVDAAVRTPGREGDPSPEEQGWLHCGPSGAGHFVKMVHNGIEYGLMQAYAEGLNVLKHANVGLHAQETDAETTPLRDPDLYKYDLDIAAVTELWRRGSVISSWLLDLTAEALHETPELDEYAGHVSDSGEGRWTVQAAVEEGVPDAGARRLAVQPVRLPRRGRLRRPRPLRDAQGLRRPPREEPGAVTEPPRPSSRRRTRSPRASPSRKTPDPCALVIFGASGDLTHKKIMPALYALAVRRLLPPRFAIVGVARTDGDDDAFRQDMETRGEAARARPVPAGDLGRARPDAPLRRDRLRRRGRRGQAARPARQARRGRAARRQPRLLPRGAAAGLPHHRRGARQAARRPRLDAARRREAVRPRPRVGEAADRDALRVLQRGRDLPDRPLPGQGDGPEHARAPLRERDLRADLEPPVRRPRPDHRGRVDRDRGARRLLRARGRDPRHLPEPPAAAARDHGDGAADRLHLRLGAQREGQGAARAAHARTEVGRARAVRARLRRGRGGRGVPRGGGRGVRLDDRDVRRGEALRRQLALGGHAVLRPDGQAARAPRDDDRDPVQGGSASAVRGDRRRRACARTCSSSTSSRTRASRSRSARRCPARG